MMNEYDMINICTYIIIYLFAYAVSYGTFMSQAGVCGGNHKLNTIKRNTTEKVATQ